METIVKIIDNISKVIIGKTEEVKLVLVALLSGGHVLIEDVPGVGKTSLVKALAKSINADFKRIQFTPDLLPSDVIGVSIYNPEKGVFEFKQGPIMSQILLADEINRTSPKTQSSLLEAMEERQVTVDGKTYMLPRPFMVIATQNPIEYDGTFRLPEAQLDRFMIKVNLGYPDIKHEIEMLKRFEALDPLEDLKPVVSIMEILKMQNEVKSVYVDDSILDYIITIVNNTRNLSTVLLGASPRAAISLMKASQAKAFIEGRNYVLPDDVKYLSVPVLSHRIILKNEARFNNLDERSVIKDILNATKVPVVKKYA
ncbi:AAA family ATPase [Thermoanaerobacterium thermosaccharolyticum]|jgi:MoxR-like ATPase|uniref:ATPase associated with various cellular activities AAA_3 n=2 Tax=Thermoanaerobacterium thermosaccharolyticum TaxID=1517 RepID=D9TSF1_THETC|nr:MoxR family ATPase [Thermoanaerobacterium thermosaccharolyticum]ADL68049.1 ATPase associated with various cellular activities AAA_3 [Thermoanaerobacterium thermosaccharolyticum DSM 571]KAA5805940.1 MoxR family ATPase [Thermoanaerobacterium thermosaccharolyticum]OXT06078.1 MoxR family ATPase [Thermoanaerobacterium thermosaccharolyticum]